MRDSNIEIKINEGKEPIERAVKRFKAKFEKIGLLKRVKDKMQFTKPSVRNRQQRLKAIYKQKMLSNIEA